MSSLTETGLISDWLAHHARLRPAHTAVIDHCVVGLSQADMELGVPQKPSRWVFNPGLGSAVPDLRCSDYPCMHRIEHSPAHHRWVIQRPPKGSPGFLAGQRHVLSDDASRVPEGLYTILDLSRWCSPAQLAHLAAPAEPVAHSVAVGGVSAASPGLPRFTAENCVYTAETLHLVFGHNVTGDRLRDTVNGCIGFRMLRSDGKVVRAPHVTSADVARSIVQSARVLSCATRGRGMIGDGRAQYRLRRRWLCRLCRSWRMCARRDSAWGESTTL